MNPLSSRYDVVIVGAGHAGAHAALALRQRRFAGSIALLSEELCLPYERPPLSKDFLSGTRTYEEIQLRSPAVWKAQGIEVLLGSRVQALDAHEHRVKLAAGHSVGYETLLWAAGGRARRLACPGHDLAGIHYIRTCVDVERLRAELEPVRNVVVIGAGYVGMEVAATLRKSGKEVAILEAQSRVLARVAGPELSAFYLEQHRAHGVAVELGAVVTAIEGDAGRASAVRLADGRRFAADVMIVGIGILPNIEGLAAAGAKTGDGVHVDARCHTSLPNVFAIGDCALHPNRFAESGLARLESVQNATDQASAVVRTLTGSDGTYDMVPWFWSQQFDLRLQTVGLWQGADECIPRGRPTDGKFSLIYLRRGRVIALDCVNASRDFIQGRQLVMSGATPGADRLAALNVELKSLVA